MPTLYCSETDVREYLPPNITTEGDNPNPSFRTPNPETLSQQDIIYFIEKTCEYIDSILGAQFDVPFKRVNQGGVVDFPKPIKYIAGIFAAQEIYAQKLQGADSSYSDAQAKRRLIAEDMLRRIQNGEMHLLGQRNNRGDRFVRSSLRSSPKNPADGGKSSA